ncbi:multidrug ABC transporter ATP-binding protein [Anaeromicropila herbilytica]|uniref:Multidrug ABC transporter ATP-binding protein n=2 Tax=Anaeromicropila herbilytica TaxID=2785025 RepID=A0A7R7EKH8_9FIRM|nr:ABC-F family ATP-binding cassette domain-containing protein [Anaeromicropila herbilytica]BCN30256.1 multidrug ABC transporter ATP-binding protein [Anaeromicropila herbilytica]
MNLLTVEKMSKTYTDRLLFDQVTLGINEGDKIGVIGINGTGKSTLLKIISGLEEGDAGNVIKGNQIKVIYLAQNPIFDSKLNILENVLNDESGKDNLWDKEGEAKSMLNRLGILEYDAKVDTLSGGQKKRIALVRALIHPADILVLDEPTNHLDNEMTEWLEDYLRRYKGAFIMVTHDRYFLDSVTNRIVEIDKGNLYSYDANYSKFLELKSEREDMELATERKNKSLYRVELEWIKRGARARSTKQKARIERFNDLKDRKKISEDKNVELNSLSSRLGKKTIELNHLTKAYGDKILFNDFNYILLKEDRIGIIGPNGCGKSTLLRVINGVVEPDSGYVEIGQTVKIGYFSQENEYMDENQRVIDYIKSVAEYIMTRDGSTSASQMLERFLFDATMQYSMISKLSGGEKRRLYLLRILMDAPNVLILDEPTNDLDIQTLNILEDYLDTFDGIVVTVSHDRYFLDRVVQRIFAFEGNGAVTQYEGGYTDYKIAMEAKDTPIDNSAVKEDKKEKQSYQKPREAKLKFSYNEQKEYETIDEVISKIESEIEVTEKKILESSTDFVKLNEFMKKKEDLEKDLEYRMERWVYLNDLAERIENEKK